MNEPCMSCGDDRSGPPCANAMGHCLKPSDHRTPEHNQVWAWVGTGWEIKGTGRVMDTAHTPDTDEVRRHYRSPIDAALDDEEFYRWLKGELAKVWDEGYTAGVGDATGYGDGIGATANPYRKETTSE